MKKMIFVLSTATALSLLLSACSGNSTLPTNSSLPSSIQTTLPSESAVATTPNLLTPSPSPTESPSPSPEPQVEITYRMNSNYDIIPIKEDGNKKVVLLTFDDGPKALETLVPILDTLDKHKAKAIFFVNGYRIKEHPELLKLIHERGQIIGNHSYDHVDLSELTNKEVDYQITEVQSQVKELTGSSPVFFRPPHGIGSEHVLAVVKQEGMLRMNWSNGSLDWDLPKNATNKPQLIVENVQKMLHKGSNILMHELAWTAEGLDNLLDTLEGEGYSFVDPNTIETTSQP
ncbi:MAG: polysaccharide deacetylase family protein [Gorillibacterium sp.]|nr:polysaccharide deacetylase family protein [Gorillibacterium sp.]